jgi:hypothetical protein
MIRCCLSELLDQTAALKRVHTPLLHLQPSTEPTAVRAPPLMGSKMHQVTLNSVSSDMHIRLEVPNNDIPRLPAFARPTPRPPHQSPALLTAQGDPIEPAMLLHGIHAWRASLHQAAHLCSVVGLESRRCMSAITTKVPWSQQGDNHVDSLGRLNMKGHSHPAFAPRPCATHGESP